MLASWQSDDEALRLVLQPLRPDESRELATHLLGERGTAETITTLLGRARDGLDQTAQAIDHYTRAVQLDRTNLRAVLALARLHEQYGPIFCVRPPSHTWPRG